MTDRTTLRLSDEWSDSSTQASASVASGPGDEVTPLPELEAEPDGWRDEVREIVRDELGE